jgi:o-succinylbenzoate synthase
VNAWEDIGARGGLQLRAVELWLVELPFVRPVLTSRGAHRSRPLALVKVVVETDHTIVEGWGECAALADSTYDAEDASRAYTTLEQRLVPDLVDRSRGDGNRLCPPSALHDLIRAEPTAPLAFAALEMAVADAHLRAEGRSLAGALGVEGHVVPVGAVVGQSASTETLVAEVHDLVGAGYSRVKIKIGPGWDVEPLEAVSAAFPTLALQADANGSYTEADIDHLTELDRFGLLCLEQPLSRTDLAGHAHLARRVVTPICLDESIDSPDSARRALSLGACSVVCIKPSRLGGLGPALELVTSCAVSGTPLWMGGMFESGYARGINVTVAALPGFSWPGDTSPASTYLGADLVPGIQLDRSGRGRVLTTAIPQGTGMGTPPDPGQIRRYSARHRLVEAART